MSTHRARLEHELALLRMSSAPDSRALLVELRGFGRVSQKCSEYGTGNLTESQLLGDPDVLLLWHHRFNVARVVKLDMEFYDAFRDMMDIIGEIEDNVTSV